MALVLKDRVKETTTTTGTGTVTLAGAVTGYQSFSAIGNGNSTYYCIAGQSGSEWEVGIGTYTASGTTLSRDTVLASSNAGSLVTFSAGTKDVFCTYAAGKSINTDANGNVTIASPAQTASNPALNITQTWNNVATTFTGIQLNVTDTASASDSELIDLQLGGSSRMNLTKGGTPTFYPQTAGDSGLKFTSAIQSFSTRFQASSANVTAWAANIYYTGSTFAKDDLTQGGWRLSEGCSSTDANSSFNISYFPAGSTGENTYLSFAGNSLASFFTGVNFSTSATLTAGTNAQGQGPITNDYTVVTTTAANPSGVTLPTATVGRRIIVVNKGTNPINLYPATGGQIDAAGTNASVQVNVGAYIELNASSTTQWYSTQNLELNPAALAYATGFTSTATAGTTTTLTKDSSYYQVFTGTTTAQTVQLPATSTLTPGWSFHIVNNTTGANLTVQSATAVSLGTIPPGVTMMPTALTNTGDTAADWEIGYTDFSTLTGTGNAVLSTQPTVTGLTLAAGTATVQPLKLTSGTNLTTAAAGSVEYDGSVPYFSIAASTRCVLPSEQLVVLNTAYTLTSQTAAQKLFNASTNGAVTLPIGTYQFECFYSLSAMSATSGSFGFALVAGTAVIGSQGWWSMAEKGTATVATATAAQFTYSVAANTTLATASTNTVGYAFIRGVVKITTAGTIIPSVSLGVAAAAVVGINSYFKIAPISGTAAANITVGNWS